MSNYKSIGANGDDVCTVIGTVSDQLPIAYRIFTKSDGSGIAFGPQQLRDYSSCPPGQRFRDYFTMVTALLAAGYSMDQISFVDRGKDDRQSPPRYYDTFRLWVNSPEATTARIAAGKSVGGQKAQTRSFGGGQTKANTSSNPF